MEYIIGKNLVAGTYTCSCAGGVEYGFTFTKPFEPPADQSDMDTEFDVVLGFAIGEPDHVRKVIQQRWSEMRWLAEAIVEAADRSR